MLVVVQKKFIDKDFDQAVRLPGQVLYLTKTRANKLIKDKYVKEINIEK